MRPGRAADLGAALVIAAAGAFLWIHASSIPFGAGYDRIGPRVFPYAVAAGLMGLGVLLLVPRFGASGPDSLARTASAPAFNPAPLAWLALALVLIPVLMPRIGFVAGAAIQFWLTARAFHSRRPIRDLAAAVLFSLIVYLAFAQGLGLALPQGPLEKLL